MRRKEDPPSVAALIVDDVNEVPDWTAALLGDIRKTDLNPERTRELVRIAQADISPDNQEARNLLMTENAALIVKIARRLSHRLPDLSPLTTDDLTHIGLLSIVHALKPYKEEKNAHFPYYWARFATRDMIYAIAQSFPMSIPSGLAPYLGLIYALHKDKGKIPSPEQILEHAPKLSYKSAEVLTLATMPFIRFDQINFRDDEANDKNENNPIFIDPDAFTGLDIEERIEDEQVVHDLTNGSSGLLWTNSFDKKIILRHYLDGIPLEDLADEFGVTPQRMRYRRSRGLANVRDALEAPTAP